MKTRITSMFILFIAAGLYSQTYSSYGYILDLSGPLPIEKEFIVDSRTKIKVMLKQISEGVWNLSVVPKSDNEVTYVEFTVDGSAYPSTKSKTGVNRSYLSRPQYWFFDVWILNGDVKGIRMLAQDGVVEGAKKIEDGVYSISTIPIN